MGPERTLRWAPDGTGGVSVGAAETCFLEKEPPPDGSGVQGENTPNAGTGLARIHGVEDTS